MDIAEFNAGVGGLNGAAKRHEYGSECEDVFHNSCWRCCALVGRDWGIRIQQDSASPLSVTPGQNTYPHDRKREFSFTGVYAEMRTPPSAYSAYFAVRIFRVARYGGLGQFKCFSKNSKVPTPLIVCGPLKNSMAARSPMPSVS